MNFSSYIYIIPLGLALVFTGLFIFKRSNIIKINLIGKIFKFINKSLNKLLPGDGSGIYKFYLKLLRYKNVSVEKIIKLKFLLFLVAIILFVLIKLTNISIYSREITSKFDYECDLIYQNKIFVPEDEAMKQELNYFYIARDRIGKTESLNLRKEELQERIKALIEISDSEVFLSKDTLSNKIYYRLYDYYHLREWNLLTIILIGFLTTLIPDIYLVIYNYFAKGDSKKELRFLKKLIIINGSIKPVDFMELVTILIDKARFYKKMLEDIEEKNKRNTVNKRAIYRELIKNAEDLDTKLFYEKLDQANNYDFDQAILNIENEFKMEKRAQLRKVRKQIEVIHGMGIIGFMLLIMILILYLIIPWIRAYSMKQII